jgi:hypothetical protein
MATPGEFRVSETGAATYTIPIQAPPGTAGMEPKLALVYNSQAGNGLLGVGWSLSGLSVIHRCPRTMAQDGVRGGVNYDANDRFCLDGQRLMAISGAYGADLTEYRTERESFSKIVSYGAAGSGPMYFIVRTKAGLTLWYGGTADSRVQAQGKATVRVWAVNRIQDVKGNYLSVTYTEDAVNGDFYPNRIDYAGNATTNPVTAPVNSVQFEYAARPDVAPLYVGGSLIKSTMRLANVKTYADSTLVHDIRLAYGTSPSTWRSRLKQITRCDAAGQCRLPTIVEWQDSGSGYVHQIWAGHGISNSGAHWVDLNGDGKADWVANAGSGIHNVSLAAGPSPDLVISVADGLGEAIQVTYAPLTDAVTYTMDSVANAAAYPILDLQAPLYVVSAVSAGNGAGGTVTSNYRYGGAKADLEGGGFLGFRWMEATQAETGVVSRTEFRQDWPHVGLPSLVTRTLPRGGAADGDDQQPV